jgi:hypothetical protein
MKMISMAMMMVMAAATISAAIVVPKPAFAADNACIKRQMAKGRSACVAKLQCEGVTSHKEQARRCG